MVKQSIITDDVRERDVHPAAFDRLRALYAESAAAVFGGADGGAALEERVCPACGSAHTRPAFDVGPATFVECEGCSSLYVNPRPSAQALVRYESESAAAGYRRSPDYLDAVGPHLRRAAAHRAEWIQQLLRAFTPRSEGAVVEVGARHPYLREALTADGDTSHAAVSPWGAEGPAGVPTLGGLTPGSARAVVALDTLERLADPSGLVSAAHSALTPGGLLIATLRAGSGFDVALLGAGASIHPLEHLNLLSVEGVRALLDAAGFTLIELSTPGHLDAERVAAFAESDAGADLPRFVRYLLTRRGPDARDGLQRFLQTHLLSSHLRVVARRA